jgi:DNA primase
VMKPDDTPKYLNSPETPLFQKGSEVYGLVQAREALRESGRILVVEGYMDVVALAQFGVGYAVATLGTATTPTHVSKLLRLTDELVFSYDGDNAGRKAAWRALETSLPLATDAKPIRFLFLPKEHDPDSYIREHGKEGFEGLVREAPTLSEFLIAELRAQHDLAKPEGRAGFLIASKTYLEKLTAPALRIQLLREFASLARVSTDDVEKLIQPNRAPAFQRPAPAKSSAPVFVPFERKLLRYVLVAPDLVEELEIDLLDKDISETSFLKFIAGREISKEATSAFLLDYFQGTDFEGMVEQAQIDIEEMRLSSKEEVVTEFKSVYLQLRINRVDQEFSELNKRAATNPALRPELQRRLQELNQLKSERT